MSRDDPLFRTLVAALYARQPWQFPAGAGTTYQMRANVDALRKRGLVLQLPRLASPALGNRYIVSYAGTRALGVTSREELVPD